jgi:hypothetical protein
VGVRAAYVGGLMSDLVFKTEMASAVTGTRPAPSRRKVRAWRLVYPWTRGKPRENQMPKLAGRQLTH